MTAEYGSPNGPTPITLTKDRSMSVTADAAASLLLDYTTWRNSLAGSDARDEPELVAQFLAQRDFRAEPTVTNESLPDVANVAEDDSA